ncbi:efflux RND transporter periplasmic adaptor subunit [Roseateles flavus]|uniref:Efflux RND transporter periplasmic adaptor subunit n=1 Tax=Roseateles flavus TaxID=3149041 RepID=A0ABV0GHS3_9BURK
MIRGIGLALVSIALSHATAWAQTSPLATDKDGRIRTQLSARNALTVSAEIAARVASLPLREGEAFRAGQTLVGFDCALYQNQQRKAEAAVEAANAVLQSNQRMAELNSIGRFEVDQSQAKLKEAQAEAASAKLLVGRCAIAAPFAGRVVKRQVAAHQYVSPGNPLLDIVETGQLELQMIVPSKWLSWLKPGSSFSVEVEELGKSYPAKVQRLGAQIDPVSQTLPVYGVMDGSQPGLLPGMSGWAVFPARK